MGGSQSEEVPAEWKPEQKAKFIWRAAAFAGEFGDPFIKDTSLEGGLTAPAIDVFVEALRHVLGTARIEFVQLAQDEIAKVEQLCRELESAAELDRLLGTRPAHDSFAEFLETFLAKLRQLRVGCRLVFTGGWRHMKGGHAIMYVVEHRKEDDWSLSVANTGNGVQYHPHKPRYPKLLHRTVICLEGIPSSRMLSADFWAYVHKIRAFPQSNHGPEVLYEIALPHLCDGFLPAEYEDSAAGDFETGQRAGTCYYRCILSMSKYLLKRDGLSRDARKRLFMALRVAYLDMVRQDLAKVKPVEYYDSDRRVIQMAVEQTAHAAVKELSSGRCLDENCFERLKTELSELAAIADEKVGEEEDVMIGVDLGEIVGSPVVPFLGFELLADDHDTDLLVGGAMEGTPSLAVDLICPVVKVEAIDRALLCISFCCARTLQLFKKRGACATSLVMHQVCALVEGLFTSVLPLPLGTEAGAASSCIYAKASISREQYLEALANIRQILAGYVAASHSRTACAGTDASRVVTATAIFSICDAVVRLRPSDSRSSLAEALAKGKMEEMGSSATRFNGQPVLGVLERAMCCSPGLLIARDATLRYFEKFGGPLFSWNLTTMVKGDKGTNIEVNDDSDATLHLVGMLVADMGLPELPPEHAASEGRLMAWSRAAWQTDLQEITLLQRRGRWCAHSWEELPEFADFRDTHFLFRLALETTDSLRAVNTWMPPTWGPAESMPRWIAFRESGGGVQFRVTTVNLEQEFQASGSDPVSAADLQRLLPGSPVAGEEDILFADNLPSFGEMLSLEEAERLMTYLTAPHVAAPLVMQFFAQGRIGCLVKPELRRLLDAVLFEAREYASEPTQIEVVPVWNDERRSNLGTRWGMLLHEVAYTPLAILHPLVHILRSAIALCLGDFRSSFVPVMLYVVRLATRIVKFLQSIEDESSIGCGLPTAPVRRQEVRELADEICKQLVAASEQVRTWLSQSEAADEVQISTNLSAHLVLLIDVEPGEFSSERWDRLVSAMAFVVSWHSKGAAAPGRPTRRGMYYQRPPAYRSRLGRRAGEAAAEAQFAEVPVAECFGVLQRRRPALLQWLSSKPEDLDSVLSHVAGAALNRELSALSLEASDGGPGWRGWQAVDDKPLMCEVSLESPHPYRPSTDEYCHVRFPGAAYISIHFDDQCSTEKDHDFVTIYKDASFTTTWGPFPELSGMGESTGNWPGVAGRPPLVVAADEFWLYFHSDASQEGWGWKITAFAPVNKEASVRLADSLLPPSNGENVDLLGLSDEGNGENASKDAAPASSTVPFAVRLRAAQKALTACRNDSGAEDRAWPLRTGQVSASEYLATNAARLIKEATDELAEAPTQQSSGIFQDPTGSVEVSLQTCEVYLQQRMLMPTPSAVADHPDFTEALGLQNKDQIPFCAVRDRMANRMRVTLLHKDRTYEICRWSPLIPRASGSLAEAEKPVCGGLLELPCYGFPRQDGDVLRYGGKSFKQWDYSTSAKVPETSQWVLSCFATVLLEAVDEAGLDEIPVLWRAMTAEDGEAGNSTTILEEHLIMHVPASGSLEERKGHPGALFEVMALKDRRLILVFALREEARRAQRMLVWASDSGVALADLEPEVSERYAPWAPGTRHAAGNMFAKLMTRKGELLPHPYLQAGQEDNPSHGSLCIRRASIGPSPAQRLLQKLQAKDAEEWGESVPSAPSTSEDWHSEVFVPQRCLQGLLPDALLDQYSFWCTGARTIRGYPKAIRTESELLVQLQTKNGRTGPESCVAMVQRLLIPPDGFTDLNALKGVSPRPMTLLNPSLAEPGSPLRQISEALKRFESAGWVLYWSEAQATLGEAVPCKLVELPRLRLRFEVRDGRLHSLEYDGLLVCKSVPDEVKRLCRGLPHALALENPVLGSLFVLIPNYEPKVLDIHVCPLNTELILLRSEGFMQAPATRYYLYPVHTSGKFLQAPSVASAFYLLLLRMLRRDYLAATQILESCFSDVPFNAEERWLMGLLSATQNDKHPNAVACRLRLALLWSELPGELKHFPVTDDLEAYCQSFAHVSQQCRLSLSEELLLMHRFGIRCARRRYDLLLKASSEGTEQEAEAKLFTQPGEEPHVAGLASKQALQGSLEAMKRSASEEKKGINTKVKLINSLRYKRPLSSRHSAASALQLVLDLGQDDVNGSRHQMGFGLLYDMLVGQARFDWVPPEANGAEEAGESREQSFAKLAKQWAPPRFQFRADEAGAWQTFYEAQLNKLQAAYLDGEDKVEIDQDSKKWEVVFKDKVMTLIAQNGESAEERQINIVEDSNDKFHQEVLEAISSMGSACQKPQNAQMAGLLAQEMLLNKKVNGNKELLCFIVGAAEAIQKGETSLLEALPFWPTGEQFARELDKGLGDRQSEASAPFKLFDFTLRRAMGQLLDMEAWTRLTQRTRKPIKADNYESRPEAWDEPVKLTDCHLGARVLSPLSVDSTICLTQQDVMAFSAAPLSQALEGVVRLAAPVGRQCLSKLPFDLSNVPAAKHEMAQNMLRRLEEDIAEAKAAATTAEVPQLNCLDTQAMATIRLGGASSRETLVHALAKVQELGGNLKAMLQVESAGVAEGVKRSETLANFVNKELAGSLAFELARIATTRATLSFEALAAAVASSRAQEDLHKINPFISSPKGWEDILQAVCVVLLRSVRVTQLRACLSATDAVQKDISALLQALQAPPHNAYASKKMVAYALRAGEYEPSQVKECLMPLCNAVENLAASLQEKCANISKQKAVAIAQLCLEVAKWDITKATERMLTGSDSAVTMLEKARRRCTDVGGHLLPLPSSLQTPAHTAADSKEVHGALEHALLHSSQHLALQVAAKRHYMQSSDTSSDGIEFTYDCRFLIFEYMVGFMLRQRQVELIRDFARDAIAGKSSVHQMIMGQGKTTVISPMLAFLLADGKRLITQVVPAELHEMSCSVLRACFQNVVKKRVYTLYFDRSSQSSNSMEAVTWLQAKMSSAREQSAVVCTSPGSVKSLLLKYVELLHVVSGAPEPLRCPLKDLGQMKGKAEQMASDLRRKALVADELAEVIRLWGPKGGGVALLDEVDLLTHPLKSELNYPIGPKMLLDGHEFRWDLPIFLLDGLFRVVTGELSVDVRPTTSIEATVNDVTAAVRDGEAQQKLILRQDVEICLLQPAYYGERFREPLARWALVWLKEQPEVEAAVQALKSQSRGGSASEGEMSESDAWQAFESYIADRMKPQDFARLNVCAAAMRMLNLAREWITGFMPYVLSKVDRVSYGLLHSSDLDRWAELEGKPVEMPQSRLLLAVPFVGKDVPARNAEFAHPEVLIGLSILAYRYEGLRVDDMKKVIRSLQAEMQFQPGPFTERPARVLFQDWLGSAARSRMRSRRQETTATDKQADDDDFEVLPLELLKVEDDDQFSTAYAALRSHPPTVYYYLQKLVFPAVMRHQDQKLTASGVDLAGNMLFDVRLGFSGTPSDLLPPCLRPCHFEPGSEAEMLRVLTDHETVDYEVIPPAWSVASLLERVANGQSRGGAGYAALIDCGALVTGFTNEEVARKLLDIGLVGMDAVVYLDASDAKMVVDRSGGRPVPLSRSGVRKERRFTFYDQVHTTGMDIRQGFDSCAVVTLGKDMTWRDYAQGCYRMRGLGSGQTLHLAVVSEIAELIHGVSQSGDMLVDVVAWLIGNSMASEQLQNLALTGQCLSDTWRQQALAALLPTKAPTQRSGYPLTSRFWSHIGPHQVAATLARTTLLTQEEINALEIKRLGDRTQAAIGQLKLILGSSAVSDLQRTYKYLMENMSSRDELVRARLFHEKLLAFAFESGIAIDLPPEGSNITKREAAQAKLRKTAAKKDLELAQEQAAAVLGQDEVEGVLAPMKKRIKSIAKAASAKHNGEGVRKGWSLLLSNADGQLSTPSSSEEVKIEADPAKWNWSLKFRFQVDIAGLENHIGLVEAYPGLWNEELLLDTANVQGEVVIDTENADGARPFTSGLVEGKVVYVSLALSLEEVKNTQDHVKSADRAVRHAAASGASAVLFGCCDTSTSEAFGMEMNKISALVVRKPYPKIPAFVIRSSDASAVKEALGQSRRLDFTGGTRLTNPSLTSAELALFEQKDEEQPAAAPVDENGAVKAEASGGEAPDIRGRALLAPAGSSYADAMKAALKHGAHLLVLVSEGQDLFLPDDSSIPLPGNDTEDKSQKGISWKAITDKVASPSIPAFAIPRAAGDSLAQRLKAGEKLHLATSYAVPQVEEEVALFEAFSDWAETAGITLDCPNMRLLREQENDSEESKCLSVRVSVLEEDGSIFSRSAAEDAYKSFQAFMQRMRDEQFKRVMGSSTDNAAGARDEAFASVRTSGGVHTLRISWAISQEVGTVPLQPNMSPPDFCAAVQEALTNAVKELPRDNMCYAEMQSLAGLPLTQDGGPMFYAHGDFGNSPPPPMPLTLFARRAATDNASGGMKASDGVLLQVLEGERPLEHFGLTKDSCAAGDAEVYVLIGISFTQAEIDEVIAADSDRGDAAFALEQRWQERKPKYHDGSLCDFVAGLRGRRSEAQVRPGSATCDEEAPEQSEPDFLQASVEVFVEGLNLHLATQPPIPRPLHEILEESMSQRADFLGRSDRSLNAAQAIVDSVKHGSLSSSSTCDNDELSRGMEVVQEQQKEEQKEKKAQKERELQSDYARNPADSVRWDVESLNHACGLLGTHVYPGGALKTRSKKRSTRPQETAASEEDTAANDVVLTPFPEQFLVSENYAPFILHSDLPRRLKNVEVLMCWTPDDVSDTFGAEEEDPEIFRGLYALARETLRTLSERCTVFNDRPQLAVCISLAEAETLRRYVSLQRTEGVAGSLRPKTVVNLVCAATGLKLTQTDWPLSIEPATEETQQHSLHNASEAEHGNITRIEADASHPVPASLPGCGCEDLLQCARFFDAQMWFSEDEVIKILRSLSRSAPSQRRVAFEALVSCKRRDRYSWEATPVAQVFHHADERTLQHLRGLLSRVRQELTRRELTPTQAFALWDQNADGWLSQSDLGTALKALGLGLSDSDIAELLQHADVDGDGFLDYKEFAAEFGTSPTGEAEEPKRRRRKARRKDLAPEKQSIIGQLQDLSGRHAGEETATSEAPLPHGVSLDGAMTNWRGLAALGSMYLTSGGHVQFHGDGRVSTQPGYRPSIKPRGVNLTCGCWYWELTVSVVGRAAVGWATTDFHGDSAMALGVGDDEQSFGFDGYTQQLYGWGKKTSFGFYWGPGDVIGVAIDVAKGEMQWSLNGSFAAPMGKAPGRLPSTAAALGLAPAVSFDSAFQFHVNLGQSPFRHRPPEGYRSVWSWVSGVQERQHAVLAGARYGKFQCTSGQAGVTIKDDTLTFTQGFPSATLAGCLLTRGKWYYEFENVNPSRCPQIGWADLDFIGASRSGVGVGDDKHSWGYDGGRAPRQGLWADGYVHYGEHWNTGDVAGAAADLEGQRLSFSLNGSWERPMGVAVESAQFTVGITPAVTAQAYGVVRVNLGERPFRYPPPPGHRGVYEWVQGMRSVLSLQRSSVSALPPPVALFRAHSAAVGGGGSSQSSTAPPTPKQHEAQEVKLRVSSGYTHASIDTAQNVVSSRDNYPSVVAEVLLFKGLWVYEVEILQLGFEEGEKPSNRRRPRGLHGGPAASDTEGEAFVGWADKRFFGDYVRGQGVGDCRHSWGWRISKKSSLVPRHGGNSLACPGATITPNVGDILTLSMSTQTGKACIFINGELRGSFDDVTPAVGLMPALSLWPGARLKMNFGPRLTHLSTLTSSSDADLPPLLVDGYRPVSEWTNVHMPPRLPERQAPQLNRSASSSSRRNDTASRQLSPVASGAQPREAHSSRSDLCLQQLRISAQLALDDGVADSDAELQGLLQQLLEHTARRLGTQQLPA